MVERRFAEELDAASDVLDGINRINDEEGVRWLYSFLSADRRKTYCVTVLAGTSGLDRDRPKSAGILPGSS